MAYVPTFAIKNQPNVVYVSINISTKKPVSDPSWVKEVEPSDRTNCQVSVHLSTMAPSSHLYWCCAIRALTQCTATGSLHICNGGFVWAIFFLVEVLVGHQYKIQNYSTTTDMKRNDASV